MNTMENSLSTNKTCIQQFIAHKIGRLFPFITILFTVLSQNSSAQPCPSSGPPITPSGNITFCYGDSVILSVADTFVSYQWELFFDDNTSILISASSTATVNTSGNMVLTVTDANGCTNYSYDTLNVYPYTLPVILSSSDTMYCALSGVLTTLQLQANYTSFLWNTTVTSNHITVTDTGFYSVTVTDANNCIFGARQYIGLYPSPHVYIGSIGQVMHCHGDTFTTVLYPYGGTEPFSNIVWSNGVTTSYDTVHTTGDYSVSVMDANGCDATSGLWSILDFPYAIPVISASGDTLISTPAINYQWYLNDTLINGATFQYYIPVTSGNYTVIVTDQWGCTYLSNEFLFAVSGFAQSMEFENKISAYPNPASETFLIEIAEKVNPSELIITDAKGEIITEKLFQTSTSINVSNWANSIYFLTITNSQIRVSKKIVVQH